MTANFVFALIACIVGIIGCVIGVATFTSARMTQAKNDGILLAKIDQCVKNTEELKKESKENAHETSAILDEHSKAIVELQTNVKSLFKQFSEIRKE